MRLNVAKALKIKLLAAVGAVLVVAGTSPQAFGQFKFPTPGTFKDPITFPRIDDPIRYAPFSPPRVSKLPPPKDPIWHSPISPFNLPRVPERPHKLPHVSDFRPF